MAQHWSKFVDVTPRQARALDRMAHDHGIGDGMDLLMQIAGLRRSKVQKMDKLQLAGLVDECFREYGDNR